MPKDRISQHKGRDRQKMGVITGKAGESLVRVGGVEDLCRGVDTLATKTP